MGISTHILDTALGRPAAGVPIALWQWQGEDWVLLHSAITDSDGRVKHLLPEEQPLEPGIFRVRFDTAAYPYVDVVFEVRAEQAHYHIPLLVTANGYSTYRGS